MFELVSTNIFKRITNRSLGFKNYFSIYNVTKTKTGTTKDNTIRYIQKLIGNEYRGGGNKEITLQPEVKGGLCSHSYETPGCVSSELFDPDLSNSYAHDL